MRTVQAYLIVDGRRLRLRSTPALKWPEVAFPITVYLGMDYLELPDMVVGEPMYVRSDVSLHFETLAELLTSDAPKEEKPA
jgi:hypothetical protein